MSQINYQDGVVDQSNTVGLDSLSVLGSLLAGCRPIHLAYPDGAKIRYTVRTPDKLNWERTEGVWNAIAGTLTRRDIPFASSNGGAKVDFGEGTKTIIVGPLAADMNDLWAAITWQRKTAAYTAAVGDHIIADTTDGTLVIDMPPTPVDLDTVYFKSGNASPAKKLNLAGNGATVMGFTDMDVTMPNFEFSLTYNAATDNWEL